MPLAPTPIVPVPSKPKIGFSIDSIVGGQSPQPSPINYSESSAPISPNSDHSSHDLHTTIVSPISRHHINNNHERFSPAPNRQSPQLHNASLNSSRTSLSPQPAPKAPPIMVPGIPAHSLIRPNPTYDPSLMPKLQPEMMHNHGGGGAPHPFALAAHFQGAALAAALSNSQHGFPPHQPGGPLHHPQPRDSYPLYPWLLSRHGRIFPHRFPGGKCIGSTKLARRKFKVQTVFPALEPFN